MKIPDKTKEEMLRELIQLKEQMTTMNKIRLKYEKTLESLRKKEEKYEFIVNAHSEYMSLINKKYIYEAVNDAYCLAVKKNREDFLGKTVQDLWGEDNFVNKIKPHLDRCFRNEIVRYEDNFKVGKTQDLYYSVNYYPYKNKKGFVTHVVAVTRDITDKKIAELELIESERMLRELNRQKDEYLSIINSDLTRAANYIISLMPAPINTEKIKTYWQLIPSSHLGGDALGYNWLDKDNLAIFILDVSGHGVGPALHSMSAFSMLRFRTLLNTDFYKPESVLNSLNRTFNMEEHYNLYFTMWYCVYNFSTRTLHYAGAGHPPLILFDKKNNLKLIEADNPVIGYSDDLTYTSNKIKLYDGSRLYMYSDGAYEIKKPDGNMMGVSDLAEYLNKQNSNDGQEISDLYKYLYDIKGAKLEDDFLMLKLHIL